MDSSKVNKGFLCFVCAGEMRYFNGWLATGFANDRKVIPGDCRQLNISEAFMINVRKYNFPFLIAFPWKSLSIVIYSFLNSESVAALISFQLKVLIEV